MSHTGQAYVATVDRYCKLYGRRSVAFVADDIDTDEKCYVIGYSRAKIDTWPTKRKALLSTGLMMCHEAIHNNGRIDEERLRRDFGVEPELVDALLAMNAILFGNQRAT